MSFLPALTIPGLTPRMDPVPDVGEHNQAILGELGLAKDI
jgi:crotonobetainyl-CoA:carnitine CoA-transferase CaiB-like acyl-CoA transferase